MILGGKVGVRGHQCRELAQTGDGLGQSLALERLEQLVDRLRWVAEALPLPLNATANETGSELQRPTRTRSISPAAVVSGTLPSTVKTSDQLVLAK